MSPRNLILGLLVEQAMSGYDIKQYVETVLRTVTNASYGTLYPALHKLLDEGAVEMQEILQEDRPSKKVYRITDKGHQQLLDWLQQTPGEDQVRREFLLKLYFADSLDLDVTSTLLAARRRQTEVTLSSLEAERDAANDQRQRWIADYALLMCRAEIAWLDQIERQMDEAS
jgi:DNA-binding PadR family transcriptional regulator